MSLRTPISQLPRMQPIIAHKFAQLGLQTLRDALFYFPFRHEDWRRRVPINQLTVDQEVTIIATILTISSRPAWHRRGTSLTEATITDDTGGKIHVVWFNMPFLIKSLKVGDQLYLSGTVTATKNGRLQLNNPVYERPSADPLHTKLVPVYRTMEGLSQRQLRLVMKQAVSLSHNIPDPLPAPDRLEQGVLSLSEALTQIHFPVDPELAHQAVQRLKFDELLGWRLRIVEADQQRRQRPAPGILFHEQKISSFVQHLPFALTDDQRVAAWQVLQDMAGPQPMSRLIQGDVGSGKTVVAALVAYNVALGHHQVALVAPTVVLARQHWQTFNTMLGKHDTAMALLTGDLAEISRSGSTVEVTHPEVLAAIADGTVSIVIGTHAVLQLDVTFNHLGLVVIDEQQRFGVDQRQVLLTDRDDQPHFLSLTATPIPRSFALWLSGILTISTIAQKPPQRATISTAVLGPDKRAIVDQTILDTIGRGQQAYVITPLIEESDTLGIRAAVSEHRRLNETLIHWRVGLLHGAMSALEQISVIEQFRRHELDVLVSTTVIEVGVDVLNATLMVIEGADRFGLAQLHQLRGRVGRGTLPSRCLLVTDRTTAETVERLRHVASTNDGFAIAELDLQERGAGDLYGQRQSGLPVWQLASLNDRALFERVRDYVTALTPELQQRLARDLREDENVVTAFHPE